MKSDELKQAEEDYQNTKNEILKELKENFKPEFLNRIDKTIVFRALTHDNIKEIVKLHLGMLQNRLKPKKLSISLGNAALDFLAHASYDPEYGARPVRRKTQDLVEDPLTELFLEGQFKEGDSIKVTKEKEELAFKKK